MTPRTIQLGLDYGTSTSKMVFWDPLAHGKPKSYVAANKGCFRFSSSVAFVGDELVFGVSPQNNVLPPDTQWYESVKMRVAAEAVSAYGKFSYGRLQPPPNLRFADLAILTLWYLRQQAADCITRKLSIPTRQLAMSVTMGVPRSFYESAALRSTFLRIARSAEWLDKTVAFRSHRLKLAEARQYIAAVQAQDHSGPVDERYWIRSEAEADMFWPVSCPGVPPGPCAQVDIGAGTTNAAIVSIWEGNYKQRWIKDKLGFYGAFSVPVGTDAIDSRLADSLKMQPEACLSLRGQERKAVSQVGINALREVFSGIREAYEFALRRATSHFNQAEKQTFRDHPIFITGGGSLIPGITEALSNDPARINFRRTVRPLERPHDLYTLDDKLIPNDDLAFLSAAYGLSYHPDEIPPTYETEPEPRLKERYIGLGVIYEK